MRIYSIFDDFTEEAATILKNEGVYLTVHPYGKPRPNDEEMTHILEEYDGVIIGTSQKIHENMFDRITDSKIIATASVGVDHIQIPFEKKSLIQILNTPKANARSVAEYTIGCALNCCKRFTEGRNLYKHNKNNKALYQKPTDLMGKTMGVIGAGNISLEIMNYAQVLGMKVICWTKHPESHQDLTNKNIVLCNTIADLVEAANYISVNLPNLPDTKGIISEFIISKMKNDAVYISVSRKETQDIAALFERASTNPGFYVCLDLDTDSFVSELIPDIPNVMVTPHIAGGTVETRKRMFLECAQNILLAKNGKM
ncbi:MAG: hypothetical protein IKQ27_00120 [Lachnospiraceae bacterium]|nr:hypothetical protein [Lachnospiraceae bacterium]